MGGLVSQILEKEIRDPEVVDEILKAIGLQSEYLYLFSKNLLYAHQLGVDPELPRKEINHVIAALEQAMRPHVLMMRSSGLRVEMSVPENATVLAVSRSFHLLLSNLLHNAAKHGGRVLAVSYHKTEEGVSLRFLSTQFENGLPIPLKVGVGLNICQQIMALQGGKLLIAMQEDGFEVEAVFF